MAGGEVRQPTVRDLIRRDIDMVLAQSFTYKSFLEGLERLGYSVKSGPNVKYTAVRPSWGQKNIRLDSLGEGYTTEGIKARLASVRSGETPPISQKPSEQPFSQWRISGKRYTMRSALPHRPRKLKGFRALYFKYLYLLGAVQRSRPQTRAAFVLRQDIIQFDRYQQQFLYLMKNRIETAGQLSMQYDALQADIDVLSDRRSNLYKQRRRFGDSPDITAEIKEITEHLRGLRRELKLCVRIERDIPKVQSRVQAVRDTEKRDKQNTPDKVKQRTAPENAER